MEASSEPVETYTCPHHGEVEGMGVMDGPLSNCVPAVVLCEECDPFAETIVGYEEEGE